jgi:hypothetical protein
MKECIVRLLVKLGILNLNDLNMRTRKRIFGSRRTVRRRSDVKVKVKVKTERIVHRGVWVKLASLDSAWVHLATQAKAAEYLRNKTVYDIKWTAVYSALRHGRNRVIVDKELIAYVQYNKPENT